MSEDNDPEGLTPLQEMITEVLTARWRLGERHWPFPVTCMRALNALARKGLVSFDSGPVQHHVRVQFTPAGQHRFLHSPYHASPLMQLAEAALFLRQNGERPPGGSETWRKWDAEAERVLRGTYEDGEAT